MPTRNVAATPSSPDPWAELVEQDPWAEVAEPESDQPSPRWRDLPGNILPSAGRAISDLASMVASAPGAILRLAQPVGGGAQPNETQQAVASMVTNPGAVLSGVKQALSDRWGSAENAKRTVITDPVGAAMDASTVLGGVGAIGTATKVPRLVRAGQAAATAGRAIDPMLGVAKGVAAAGNVVRPSTPTLQRWGTRWMQSAMKTAKTIDESNIHDVAEVAARRKIMPTEEGFRDAAAQAKVLKKQASGKARAAYKAGEHLDPLRIKHRMDREVQHVSAADVDPERYATPLREKRDTFWQNNSRPTQVEVELAFPERTGTGFDASSAPVGTGMTQQIPIEQAPIMDAQMTGTGWLQPQAIRRPTPEVNAPRTGTTMEVVDSGRAPLPRFSESPTGLPLGPQTTQPHLLREGPREAVPLSVNRSMAMTERLNQRLPHGKRDPLGVRPAPTPGEDAEHALAAAIRAERERVAPGMNALNQERGEVLSVMKQLQNYTLRREGNMDPIPARALLGGGLTAGLAAAGAPVGAVVGGTVVPWVVNSPAFKGKQAIRLYHGDTILDNAGRAMRNRARQTTMAGAVGTDVEDAIREALLQAMERSTETP